MRPTERQKNENMEALIESIVEKVKSGIDSYGYCDRWQICDELSRRIAELGDEALKQEYMIDDMEGGEE